MFITYEGGAGVVFVKFGFTLCMVQVWVFFVLFCVSEFLKQYCLKLQQQRLLEEKLKQHNRVAQKVNLNRTSVHPKQNSKANGEQQECLRLGSHQLFVDIRTNTVQSHVLFLFGSLFW